MKWTAVAVVACGLTATVLVHRVQAAAPVMSQLGGDLPRHGRILEKLASLGITDEQRDQIKAILREARPKAQPLMKQFVTERRTMRTLLHNGASEAEIRAQATKVASVATDLAVLRSQFAPKVKAVLTPEQQKKAQDMISEFDQKVDAAIERAGSQFENNQRAFFHCGKRQETGDLAKTRARSRSQPPSR